MPSIIQYGRSSLMMTYVAAAADPIRSFPLDDDVRCCCCVGLVDQIDRVMLFSVTVRATDECEHEVTVIL